MVLVATDAAEAEGSVGVRRCSGLRLARSRAGRFLTPTLPAAAVAARSAEEREAVSLCKNNI